MGVAAYNRASNVVKARIAESFDENRKGDLAMIERAEALIAQFDQFSRDAQNLYWESVEDSTARGSLRSHINLQHKKKCGQAVFHRYMSEAAGAHAHWVDADRRDSIAYMFAARRKAAAWKSILTILNKSYHLPFDVPNLGD